MIARLYFLRVYIYKNKRTQESGHLTPITGSYVSRWLGVYQLVPPSFRNSVRNVSSSFCRQEEIKQVCGSNYTDVPTVRCSFFKFALYISPPLPQEPLLKSPFSWPGLGLPKVIGALFSVDDFNQAHETRFNQR